MADAHFLSDFAVIHAIDVSHAKREFVIASSFTAKFYALCSCGISASLAALANHVALKLSECAK